LRLLVDSLFLADPEAVAYSAHT